MGHVGFAWIVPAWIAIGALPFAAGAIYRRWQYGPRQTRQAIRHLEQQINNPAVRAMYLDQPREEKP